MLEVVGRQQTVRDAIRMTRRGGQVVLVGAAGDDVTVSLPAFSGIVMTEKSSAARFTAPPTSGATCPG